MAFFRNHPVVPSSPIPLVTWVGSPGVSPLRAVCTLLLWLCCDCWLHACWWTRLILSLAVSNNLPQLLSVHWWAGFAPSTVGWVAWLPLRRVSHMYSVSPQRVCWQRLAAAHWWAGPAPAHVPERPRWIFFERGDGWGWLLSFLAEKLLWRGASPGQGWQLSVVGQSLLGGDAIQTKAACQVFSRSHFGEASARVGELGEVSPQGTRECQGRASSDMTADRVSEGAPASLWPLGGRRAGTWCLSAFLFAEKSGNPFPSYTCPKLVSRAPSCVIQALFTLLFPCWVSSRLI